MLPPRPTAGGGFACPSIGSILASQKFEGKRHLAWARIGIFHGRWPRRADPVDSAEIQALGRGDTSTRALRAKKLIDPIGVERLGYDPRPDAQSETLGAPGNTRDLPPDPGR